MNVNRPVKIRANFFHDVFQAAQSDQRVGVIAHLPGNVAADIEDTAIGLVVDHQQIVSFDGVADIEDDAHRFQIAHAQLPVWIAGNHLRQLEGVGGDGEGPVSYTHL